MEESPPKLGKYLAFVYTRLSIEIHHFLSKIGHTGLISLSEAVQCIEDTDIRTFYVEFSDLLKIPESRPRQIPEFLQGKSRTRLSCEYDNTLYYPTLHSQLSGFRVELFRIDGRHSPAP